MRPLNEMITEFLTLKRERTAAWQSYLSTDNSRTALRIDAIDQERNRIARRINEAMEQVYLAYLTMHGLAALHEGNDGGPLSDACDAALAAYNSYRNRLGLQPGDIKVR